MDPFSQAGATQGQAGAVKKRAKVKFDYPGQDGNYISLQKGSVIDIVHVGAKGGWTKGVEISTGKSFRLDFHASL